MSSDARLVRMGQFEVSDPLIRDVNSFDGLQAVMRHMVVVACNYRPESDSYHYVALSKLFDEVDVTNTSAPWYSIQLQRRAEGPVTLQGVTRLDASHSNLLHSPTPPKARLRRIIESV